jgi:hypothetical protein
MSSRTALIVTLALPLTLLACGGGGAEKSAADGAAPVGDAAVSKTCSADRYVPTATCGAHPAGPYGSKPGEVFGTFSPALKDCNLSPVKLREIACGSDLLLVSIGAGWCQPCIEEMKTIEKQVHERFCGRGLGIVSVLFQDERRDIPTSAFCATWRQQFGLTFPVLIDQLQQTTGLMDYKTGTPLNLLIDPRTMKILFRWSGEVPKGLDQQIDLELKKLGK